MGRRKNNIKIDLREMGVKDGTGLNRLRMGYSGRLLWYW
jgi:hypothetical protein